MPASRRARGDQLPILEADGWILEGTEGVLEADSPFRVPLSVTILLNPPAWAVLRRAVSLQRSTQRYDDDML